MPTSNGERYVTYRWLIGGIAATILVVSTIMITLINTHAHADSVHIRELAPLREDIGQLREEIRGLRSELRNVNRN